MAGKHKDFDLDSDFEYSAEKKQKTWRDDPIATLRAPGTYSIPSHSTGIPSKEFLTEERDKEEWKARRFHFLAMDAYARHKALVNQYLLSTGMGIESVQRSTAGDRNDYTVLQEEHKFLWDTTDKPDTWEKKLAKTYYDKLFKEYAIADLSRYKENKVALRWRIEKEVIEGKGQFLCGNKKCLERTDLESWEVNFCYMEQGEKKNALVKLRLCSKCSRKLNYHHKRRKWKSSDKKSEKSKKTHTSKHTKKKRSHKHGDSKHREESNSSNESSESEGDTDRTAAGNPGAATTSEPGSSGDSIWKKPAEVFLEKSQDDEFDDYFKDMFM